MNISNIKERGVIKKIFSNTCHKLLLGFILIFFSVQLIVAQNIYWANKVYYCSDKITTGAYSCENILGVPDVYHLQTNASSKSWVMAYNKQTNTEFSGDAFVKVGFCKPLKAKQLVIFENFNPGAIEKIFVFTPKNDSTAIYNSNPKEVKEKQRILHVNISCHDSIIGALIIAKPNVVEGWNCIDAIGITTDSLPFVLNFFSMQDSLFEGEPVNLGSNINTEYQEAFPIIAPDGQTLFFCRKNCPENTDGEKDDVWVSYWKDNTWSLAENIGKPINNSGFNFVCSVLPDGNTLLLGNTYNEDGTAKGNGVSISKRTKSGWTVPKEIIIENYINLNRYASYFLSNSGKILLMTCQRNDSYGQKDIYVSFLHNEKFSAPLNLGATINTEGDEVYAFLAADEKTLYFASDGHLGYGSADIFFSKRLDDSWTNWSNPVNLGKKINTSGWESYFSIDAKGEWAYFVSNKNTFGGTDIFRIKLSECKPEPVVLIKGKVLNSKTLMPVLANIYYNNIVSGEQMGIASSNPNDGSYSITLPYGKHYAYYSQANGYLSSTESIDLSQILQYQIIEKNLLLTPIEEGQILILKNIYFEQGKSKLLEASFFELDRLVNELKNNNKLKIEISGHTDNRGSHEADNKLSLERADAVKVYLVSKGISADRIITKGYGKTKPIANNDTEEGRSRNRRVELKIIQLK